MSKNISNKVDFIANRVSFIKLVFPLISTIFIIISGLLSLFSPPVDALADADATLKAQNRFVQVSLVLNRAREYDHHYDKISHTLTLEIRSTDIEELGALDHYDEQTIKRVILKQKGPNAQVLLTLKDSNLSYRINQFDEPFRLIIDIYDRDYKQNIDQVTQLPSDLSPASEGVPEHLAVNDMVPQGALAQDSDAAAAAGGVAVGKYALVKPLDTSNTDEATLNEKVPIGIGRGWKDFPMYIYRLNTAPFKGRRQDDPKQVYDQSSNFKKAQDLAKQAEKLLDYGNEGKALAAYQQALQLEPRVFDQDSLHLWNMAELHLAQKNLALGDGYYQALIDKHPNSTLAKYARIRRADMQVLRSDQAKTSFTGALQYVKTINTLEDQEAKALILIRQAFWGFPINERGSGLPQVNAEMEDQFKRILPAVESSRTAFLVASIVLEAMSSKESPWSQEIATFADLYFSRFNDTSDTIVIQALKEQLRTKLAYTLEKEVDERNYQQAINIYESLPKGLKSIRKTPSTAWALGEAYRNLQQFETALGFYRSASTDNDKIKQFKAQFWISTLTKELYSFDKGRLSPEKRRTYLSDSSNAQTKCNELWKGFERPTQDKVYAEYRPHFEDTIQKKLNLKFQALTVLDAWSKPMSTESPSSLDTDKPQNNVAQIQGGKSVLLLSRLAETFEKLKLPKERHQALALLKTVKPAEFSQDELAKKVWTEDLVKLAEEYRQSNNYLEAGETYAFTAENSQNWDKRGESLYKAGLLYYRAGKKVQALDMLKKACNDGENLFYKNMACERLDQLEEKK